jgi:hypothetical protein
MAQRPLDSDRSNFLGCCMMRRRLTWSRRLKWRRLRWRWRWRFTWSRILLRSRTVRRMTVRRRRVQDRGRLAAADQLHVR